MASSSREQARVIHPGPDDPSVLHLQSVHVSEHIWKKAKRKPLKTRKSQQIRAGGGQNIPATIVDRLQAAGLYGVASIQVMPVDRSLITALVDRWRPETHTFHMLPGECTITLQDIAIQLGLRIDGRPVIGSTAMDKFDVVKMCLGIRPTNSDFNGSGLKMSWLDNHFNNVADHIHHPEQLNRFTRAYMLKLIGGFMLADHSSSRVNIRYLPLLYNLDEVGTYSWGSAALAYLYRELCNVTDISRLEIGGLTSLVQLWVWERFPIVSPPQPAYNNVVHFAYASRWDATGLRSREETKIKHYQRLFDRLERDEIIWEPYSEGLIAQLPDICTESQPLWRAVVPLICYHIVEWHQPDRVMRQFGMVQHIPFPPSQPENLHDITLRGKITENWEQKLAPIIQVWNARHNYMWTNPPQEGLLGSNDEYMRWYMRITRRWILPDEAVIGRMHDVHERLHYLSCTEGQSSFSFGELSTLMETCLQLHHQEHRLTQAGRVAPPPSQEGPIPQESIQVHIPRSRREGGGLRRHRNEVQAEQYSLPPFPVRDEGLYHVPPEYPFFPSQQPESTYYHSSQMYTGAAGPSGHADYFGGGASSQAYHGSPHFIPTQSSIPHQQLPFDQQQSAGIFFTPPFGGSTLYTPGSPVAGVGGHSRFDLNSGEDNIIQFDLGGDDDDDDDDDAPPIRRNLPRHARNRPRGCGTHSPHRR